MRSGYWAMIALPPERMPATADEERWLAAIAAYERVADPPRARLAYSRFLERWPASTGASIGLVNMGGTPLRARAAEDALAGGASVADAASAVAEGTDPPSDLSGSAEYRTHLAQVMARRALEQATA